MLGCIAKSHVQICDAFRVAVVDSIWHRFEAFICVRFFEKLWEANLSHHKEKKIKLFEKLIGLNLVKSSNVNS